MNERTYSTPLGKIHYWVHLISPDAITLVFLPGLTADHRLFDKQIVYFQGKYNVLVWDAPGHAASWPFAFDFDLMDKARWLDGILEQEGITKPVIVGQSMGGYVGQAYNAVARGMYADIGFEEIKEVAYLFSGRQFREMQMVKTL